MGSSLLGLHVDYHVPYEPSTWTSIFEPYVISPVGWCGHPNLNPDFLCMAYLVRIVEFEPSTGAISNMTVPPSVYVIGSRHWT